MKVIQVAIKWTIKLGGVKFPPHVSHSSLILCVAEGGVSGRKYGVQRLESMLPTAMSTTAISTLCEISETVTEIRKSVTNGFTDGQTDRRHPSKPPVQNCQKILIFGDFLIPLSHKIHTKPRCDKTSEHIHIFPSVTTSVRITSLRSPTKRPTVSTEYPSITYFLTGVVFALWRRGK